MKVDLDKCNNENCGKKFEKGDSVYLINRIVIEIVESNFKESNVYVALCEECAGE